MKKFLLALTTALTLISGGAYAVSMWDAPSAAPATGTMRFPVCTSSSCSPLRLQISDVQSFILNGGGNFTGNAATATLAATATVANTVAVTDSTDATSFVAFLDSATGNLAVRSNTGLTFNATTGALTATSFNGTLVGSAAAGSLTGTTLASNVVNSSLTSTGTLTGLNVGGQANITTTTANQLTVGYDVSNSAVFDVSSGGNLTITPTGIITMGGTTRVPNGIQTASSSSTSNFVTVSTSTGQGAASASNANIQLGGATNTNVRVYMNGGTSTAASANNSYGSLIIGAQGFTEAGSGTTAVASNLAVKGLIGTNAGGATTAMASLYVEGAASGNITPTAGSYSIFVDADPSRFDGDIGLTANRVPKIWATDLESTNCPTIGGTACSGTGGLARATSPTFVTPTLGAASATTVNGLTITATTSGTLTLANSSSLITSGANALTLTTSGTTNATFPSGTVTVTTTAATQTLTNKRITPRVQSVASSATVTPNADTDDEVVVTAQAAAINFANPSGTPTQGQAMILRLKDNGTARAITYGTQYRAIGLSLPTTTVISKTLYLAMIWNAEDSKWDVTGIAQEL